ncbi:hypothetical protein HL13_gp77 [Dinoroseobacter phage DFL12phi1]|uniref:NADAR domain-containing protein n=2 Tax=Baltimorevirus DFL12 TaxID=2169868 RepID=A0A023NGG8_9CAUD|nr:hypothetical protein HL13_gp77 [Dinoroseobacter phage DFL12phi1]AHX01037.1 hypothetical protein DFL12P1_0077 [Dinoroseobacter phage DFL12phi1]AID16823.1 hypothetical protein vBDshPR2C_07 [Dinoroseobacter phage vBDshPR2C]
MTNVLETAQKPIMGFRDEYRWLSNFYHAPITVTGFEYDNTEAAYQAAKTINIQHREQFKHLTGAQAKKQGRNVILRHDWDFVKLEIMELVLRAKFMTHPDLAQKLKDTGSRDIIEFNTWGDTYWGQIKDSKGKLVGDNILGKLLMNIRSDIK